ncbi:MAG: DsrE family protein [Flavobacteriaceae bacterium]|nr:DsrE family protein [Flavobacteriaceae bacterium]
MQKTFLMISFCLSCLIGFSQTQTAGVAVPDFGKFYRVDQPEFKTDKAQVFRVLFDMVDATAEKSQVHPFFNTAARFLNMHTDAGIPLSQLHVALVVHGGAFDAVLNDEAYMEKHGIKNPNTALIQQLTAAGAQIILCGQTAAHRGITPEKRNPDVMVALSAMTAILQLQNQDYKMIF